MLTRAPAADGPLTPVLERLAPELWGLVVAVHGVLRPDERHRVVELLPDLEATVGDGLDVERGLLRADWSVWVFTAAWLDVAGLSGETRALRELRPLTDADDVLAARAVMRSVALGATRASMVLQTSLYDRQLLDAWYVADRVGRDLTRAAGSPVAMGGEPLSPAMPASPQLRVLLDLGARATSDAARLAVWRVMESGGLAAGGVDDVGAAAERELGGMVGRLRASAIDLLGRAAQVGV
ncbi:hypothetical protein HIR71_08560 [Cellulomonas fimi]|uniref:Uncharacterized protein n=1 Tax=Cellulomonas fimi TaxID=1708 RepID=A0A7Y0QHK3_CELFI|nr:hypothetical protein [Cellulomonas fimi]